MIEYAQRDSALYYCLAKSSRRPLSLSEATLISAQIANIAKRHQIAWAVIGGAAVALHLESINHPAAWSRTSSDFDIAASETPRDPRIRWGAPLVAGGRVGILSQRRIDWLVRHDANDPLRALQSRLIWAASTVNNSIMLPPADAICALKVCLSERAFRPKDYVDCRLLMEAKLATNDGITAWLQQTISNKTTRRYACANLARITNAIAAAA